MVQAPRRVRGQVRLIQQNVSDGPNFPRRVSHQQVRAVIASSQPALITSAIDGRAGRATSGAGSGDERRDGSGAAPRSAPGSASSSAGIWRQIAHTPSNVETSTSPSPPIGGTATSETSRHRTQRCRRMMKSPSSSGGDGLSGSAAASAAFAFSCARRRRADSRLARLRSSIRLWGMQPVYRARRDQLGINTGPPAGRGTPSVSPPPVTAPVDPGASASPSSPSAASIRAEGTLRHQHAETTTAAVLHGAEAPNSRAGSFTAPQFSPPPTAAGIRTASILSHNGSHPADFRQARTRESGTPLRTGTE